MFFVIREEEIVDQGGYREKLHYKENDLVFQYDHRLELGVLFCIKNNLFHFECTTSKTEDERIPKALHLIKEHIEEWA